MADLEALRTQIDEVDAQIVTLLERRADIVLQVKAEKTREKLDIYSPARERQIIDRVTALGASGSFPQESLASVFRTVVSATRSLIGELAVSYIGPEFSYAHQAALKQFGPDVRFQPVVSIAEVFQQVESGQSQFGLVPLESTTHGLETLALERFMETSLQVIAEVYLTEQIVLASTASTLSDLKRVYADAPTLARATKWSRTHLLTVEQRVVENPTLAAEAAQGGRQIGALVPKILADKYQLNELASGVENDFSSRSRHFVIGQRASEITGGDKTTLLSVVKDRTGALRDLLTPFADGGVTLTKIESKSRPESKWEYVFVIDIIGHKSEPKIAAAIEKAMQQSSYLKVLGSYPSSSV